MGEEGDQGEEASTAAIETDRVRLQDPPAVLYVILGTIQAQPLLKEVPQKFICFHNLGHLSPLIPMVHQTRHSFP